MSNFILLVRSFMIDIFNLDIFLYFLVGFIVLLLIRLVLRLALG